MDRSLKTFFIRTYGCQMNELDSEIMVGLLIRRGLLRVEKEEDADLLLFNTCAVRDLAERKVMGKLGIMGRGAKKNPLIGITGCMAMTQKEKLFQKFPHLDFVIGTNNLHEMNAILDEVIKTKRPVCHTDDRFTKEMDYLSAVRESAIKAHVSIIRGCNKRCTYCVVPYTRGIEVSRPPKSIIEECNHLVDKGYKEITLLGQNVNSYGNDQPGWNYLFHDLLYQLNEISGLERIRFMTSHPVDITHELMLAIRDLPKLCEYVHFPLQAGSNRILKKMHRMYTREEYFEKVAKLKEIIPSVAIGTDIIVGFPSETEEEFEETVSAFETLRFSQSFIFAYSSRKNTPAKRWSDDVPKEEKERRLQKLLELQEKMTKEELHSLLGQTREVLVESQIHDGKRLKGRTRCGKKVVFSGNESLIGSLQNVALHSYHYQTLTGTLKD